MFVSWLTEFSGVVLSCFTGFSLDCFRGRSVQFSPLTWPIESPEGEGGDTRDDSAEILFQSFMQEAFVGSFGLGRNVHSLMLSIQHFLCLSRRRPPSKVPWRMVLETLFWHVTCPNHANFHLLAAKRQICLRFLILTQPPLPGSCFVLLLTGQTLDCVSLVPQIWSSKFCFCHHKVVGKMNKHKKLITCHAQCA